MGHVLAMLTLTAARPSPRAARPPPPPDLADSVPAADSPGRRQPEPARRDQPPGGKHQLVRLCRHHRHVHERVRQLDAAAGTCSRGDQYAAFWVGLDGYTSSSVEQTGSEVDCVGRTAEYYAWYEMYPGPSENYSNTVRAGDHFNAR